MVIFMRFKKQTIFIFPMLFLILSLNFSPASAGLGDIFYDSDGVVNPDPYYERYRNDEYSDSNPFFQWWYFTIKDLETNRYFAFDYSISDCASDLTNEGTYMMFSMVDKSQNINFHKYERFPLSSFLVSNDFDIQVPVDNVVDYGIEIIDSDTYHVTGRMDNYASVWTAINCDPNLFIEWDLTIHRIYGWYGQQDCEDSLKTFGVISWNTYAHDAEVEGTITIGSTVYTISRNENFRAYCDMNWGENFPAGDPAIDYPWGWYYAGRSDANTANDLSIIAGVGRHDAGFPFGTCLGKFADVRLDSNTHIGLRQSEIWSEGYSLMETSNDGDVKQFNVERDQWTLFTDDIGSALIPLHQEVTLETDHYIVVMDFYSELSDYNRLLFPHEDYIFSDFEGLGVDVHVTVTYHYITYSWWDVFHLFPNHHYSTLEDFWTDDGGLEFGYDVD